MVTTEELGCSRSCRMRASRLAAGVAPDHDTLSEVKLKGQSQLHEIFGSDHSFKKHWGVFIPSPRSCAVNKWLF